MKRATVLPQHGLSPIGGAVDGVDQMDEHRDNRNELRGGAEVTISAPKKAIVTTWGKAMENAEASVVTVEGKAGYYLASAFSGFSPTHA